jgi:hypothetical protein
MISRYDCAATPLAPLPDWPASLRTAVDICVSSPFPMVIFWGPEFRLLYNDAYVPMGAKHPGSLGQPASHIWAEIWPTIGPVLTGVLRTGQVTFSEEQLLIVQRAGYRKRSAVEAAAAASPPAPRSGWTVAMMRAFMTDVVIEPTLSGTTVRMSRDVR